MAEPEAGDDPPRRPTLVSGGHTTGVSVTTSRGRLIEDVYSREIEKCVVNELRILVVAKRNSGNSLYVNMESKNNSTPFYLNGN